MAIILKVIQYLLGTMETLIELVKKIVTSLQLRIQLLHVIRRARKPV